MTDAYDTHDTTYQKHNRRGAVSATEAMTETTAVVHVLHVDDDPEFGELAATFLEREDDRFVVETVTSVADAFDCLDEAPVDCIVSDYEMPGSDGIEFLEAVREEYPDLPFVLFTGRGSEEVASEAISAGVTDYLQKGSGTSQYAVLANRIANAVEQYRSRRALDASRRRLALFFERSPLGVIEWDDDFTVKRLNDAAEEILGYAEADLRGRGWNVIVSESDEAAVDDVVSELLDGTGGYHSINENVTKEGETIVCEWHNRIVTDEGGDVVAIFSQFQDVTERRRHREELERHRAIIQAAASTIITVDESNTILSANPSVEGTFGYAPEDVVGEPLTTLMADDVAERHTAAFEQYLDTTEQTLDWEYTEFEGQHRDGSAVPLAVTFGEVVYEGERYFVGILRDLTAQREREQELEGANALLSTLIETLPAGVLAEDASRNVLTVNQRLIDLFGMSGSPEELAGADCERLVREVDDLFVEDDEFVDRTNDLIDEQTPVFNEEWELRDGRTFSRGHRPIELPNGEGHLWVYHDVTERAERERRLEALNETSRELVSATTREAVAEIGVSAARDVLGLEANAIHLYDEKRAALPPVAATDAVSELVGEPPTFTGGDSVAWRVYRDGDPLALGDVHDDPDVYNPETPVRSELHLPIGEYGILIAGSPTPEAFDAEDVVLGEILAANVATALEQVDRTEQLRAREAELSRQNERLEEFASVVSHDLRNPLNVADGHLELLRDECESDRIDDIATAHTRMADLIDDLLALAREGESVSETEWIDLECLVGECWGNVATADATVVTDVTGRIAADRNRLKQLLENVFRNAVEHGSTGSRTRADDAVEHGRGVTVTVGTLDDGFYVADDGPGIPEDERERVFEAGYSTTESGSGFGLAIVERVADAHGWSVRVTDGADGGTRFEVTGVDVDDGDPDVRS